MSSKTLVIIRIILYTISAIGLTWQTAMNNVVWLDMRWEEQSCLIAGMTLLWSNTMIAYFDKSMWKLDQETTEKRLSLLNGVKPE
jgi:hypothetical protein